MINVMLKKKCTKMTTFRVEHKFYKTVHRSHFFIANEVFKYDF